MSTIQFASDETPANSGKGETVMLNGNQGSSSVILTPTSTYPDASGPNSTGGKMGSTPSGSVIDSPANY